MPVVSHRPVTISLKDSPQYLHDGSLPTLADAVEFFNLIPQWKLDEQEKKDLVDFMRVL